jgi:hypothetical protein
MAPNPSASGAFTGAGAGHAQSQLSRADAILGRIESAPLPSWVAIVGPSPDFTGGTGLTPVWQLAGTLARLAPGRGSRTSPADLDAYIKSLLEER